MADNNTNTPIRPTTAGPNTGNQIFPPPMWDAQFWQGQGLDPTHPGTITGTTSQMINPTWSQGANDTSSYPFRNPWNPFFGMMNPGGPPPQTSFGQAQFVPPTPYPQVDTHVTNRTDPINLESEAKHSVQEVNSPTKPSDTPGTVRRTKEQNFKPDEDLLLCKTWLEISSDPVISTGQRKEGLWARIEKRYNKLRGEFPMRLNRALSSIWDKIRAKTGKFAGFYARVLRENQSGLTDNDKVKLHSFVLLKYAYGFMCTKLVFMI
jgi:hypothetical protein